MSDELNEIELAMFSAETLEDEGRAAGLQPVGRREITADRSPRRLHGCPFREGGLMELRFLALYPEQMNIYADRGNVHLPAATLRVAGHRLCLRQRRPR